MNEIIVRRIVTNAIQTVIAQIIAVVTPEIEIETKLIEVSDTIILPVTFVFLR